jgi:endonuclease/exonuclease/phosphatase family metal-dependent hydrolase
MVRFMAVLVAMGVLGCLLGLASPPAGAPKSAPGATPPETDAAAFIVMSFNIRYGTANDGENAWPKRRQMVIDRIRASAADVVGLQEALKPQIDELLAAMPEYASVGVGRDNGKTRGEHCAILYRREGLSIQPVSGSVGNKPSPGSGDFWYSDTPGTPGSKSWGNNITRICSWARFVRTGTEQAFFVFNTHLDHESQPSREKSVLLLKDRIARRGGREPVIVMGDFNAGEQNPAIVTMRRVDQPDDAEDPACPPLRDSFRVVHPDEKRVGTFNAFRGISTGEKIDYIFVDDGWDVVDAAIDFTMPDGRCPSDHFPVIAALRPKSAATADPKP